MIAALYVATGGTYFRLAGVIPYDERRDARKYRGPHPVVAHPPCARWGRYFQGGPSAKVKKIKGDDKGCFAAALDAVRQYGGILEHPEASSAWAAFGLTAPPREGGWVKADDFGGFTCCVAQGHYGHKANKFTWLYAVRCELPQLKWGKAEKAIKRGSLENLSQRERLATPAPFRNLLLKIARTVKPLPDKRQLLLFG